MQAKILKLRSQYKNWLDKMSDSSQAAREERRILLGKIEVLDILLEE